MASNIESHTARCAICIKMCSMTQVLSQSQSKLCIMYQHDDVASVNEMSMASSCCDTGGALSECCSAGTSSTIIPTLVMSALPWLWLKSLTNPWLV